MTSPLEGTRHMKSPLAKRDHEHDVSRRALIKWTVAAGAALGVSRGKIIEILEKTAGKETAYAAAESPTTRSFHIVAARGSLSWFTLLFPQVGIAQANNDTFAYHTPGQGAKLAGTDKPYFVGPDTPWAALPASKQFTGFVCGSANTHMSSPNPDATVLDLGMNNVFSFASGLQSSTPAIVPAIAINENGNRLTSAPLGAAAVDSAADIVGLFNSAASRAGGLLAQPQNATTYAVQYAAFAQLNRASGRSTQRSAYNTAVGAAGFLGTNLAAQLKITDADETRYGVGSGTPNNIKALADAMIVAVKAFQRGLTNSIVLPAMNDDPHGAFAGGGSTTVPPMLKKMFDAFMADLQGTTDSATGQALADDTVITISGDTPKNALTRTNWPDNSVGGANLMMVYSAGHLKSGWFGSMNTNNTVTGFDQTGADATFNAANTSKFALASVAYAIAKGDERAISAFSNGITVSGNFGRPKNL